jgi:hypothetical protein
VSNLINIERAGTHGVTGRFLFRTPGSPLMFSNTNKCNAHLFCSYRSPSVLVSVAEKRAVNRAIARSVNAVPDSLLIRPYLFATVDIWEKLGGLGRRLR